MILAFDIGGTKIAAGLVDEADMRIVSALSRPSPNHLVMKGATRIEILHALGAELRTIFEQFGHEHAIAECSIAFPAAVDAYENVHRAPTLWGNLDGPPVSLGQVFLHEANTASGTGSTIPCAWWSLRSANEMRARHAQST